jgi:hypothetical protein
MKVKQLVGAFFLDEQRVVLGDVGVLDADHVVDAAANRDERVFQLDGVDAFDG